MGDGGETFIQADSVVIYDGREPRREEALMFHGITALFYIIGDSNFSGIAKRHSDGNVASATRSAFAAASQI
jgi:hypothetical protein